MQELDQESEERQAALEATRRAGLGAVMGEVPLKRKSLVEDVERFSAHNCTETVTWADDFVWTPTDHQPSFLVGADVRDLDPSPRPTHPPTMCAHHPLTHGLSSQPTWSVPNPLWGCGRAAAAIAAAFAIAGAKGGPRPRVSPAASDRTRPVQHPGGRRRFPHPVRMGGGEGRLSPLLHGPPA